VETTGRQAYTEVLYRRPGRLAIAWTRDRILRRRGPITPDRSGFARWLFGPVEPADTAPPTR
jgi:hypothetical protein